MENTLLEKTIETITDLDQVYLKPNLVLEPLFDNWYAWAHLISPATAALNIKERHLKIMASYIKNPRIHAAAVRNPKMLGGPFIDYDGQRVDEIAAAIQTTEEKCADLLELGEAIHELNQLLRTKAQGYALAELYPEIPEPLQGLVELVYDLNHQASFRFFEPLLYQTKFYQDALQSFNLFLIDDDDARSFVLSTPKLPDEQTLRVNLPFKSKKIDALFDCIDQSRQYGELKELFELEEQDETLFRNFFTKTPPSNYQRYQGDGVLTRYFGHACVLVETPQTSILVDPVVSYGYDTDLSRYTYADLPETIDYVLITHNHQDHVLFETLLRLRRKIKNIIVPRSNGGSLQDPSLKLMFEHIGFENIIELGEMESVSFDDVVITGLPFIGEHCDLDVRSKLCHHVAFQTGFKVIFAADSCNVSPQLYQRVKDVVGEVDALFLGMECEGAPLSWLYGPLLYEKLAKDKDESRRLAGCNYNQSRALIDIFNPQNIFVYAMGMEPWLKYISSIKYTDESLPIIESDKLLEYCREKGIESERLFGEKIIEYR